MQRTRDAKGGQTVILIAMLSTFLFSLAGLATDFVWAYVIKQRLTAAVDAASLSAVRALGRGSTNMGRVIGMVFDANFPTGFMMAKNISYVGPTISTPSPGVRSVWLEGRATAPTFFLRIWGFNNLPVKASATASRRDVNLMMVLDRSGSLHPSNADAWDDVQQAATFFIEQFDQSRDRLGLVTFGTSAAIDVALNTNTQTSIISAIANQQVAISAATNSPEGLWLAYAELARVADPNPLNVVIFFTDGQPSAYSARFQVRTSSGGSNTTPYCSGSPRDAVVGSLQSGADFYEVSGFWQRAAATPVTLGSYFGSTYDHYIVSGCNNNNSSFDPYGGDVELLFLSTQCLPTSWTPTQGSVTRTFSISTGPYSVNQCSSLLKSTSTTWSNRTYRGTQVHNASKNLSVNIATAARGDVGLGGARIYSIGLGGWGYPADADFLERVSNDLDSVYYDPNQPSGLYAYAPTPSQLQQAFNQVASEVFRLVR
ncbi:MAG: VWA domain-containing protein [Acidobacteria bacterium]|nr:VWA domain-containing protein [Acidobacteriota bacterium]